MFKIFGFVLMTRKEYYKLEVSNLTQYYSDLVTNVFGFKGMYGYDKKSKDFIRKEIKKYFKK